MTMALAALGAFAALLAEPAGTAPVPLEQAPYHRLVFGNDELAVIETIVPPGGDSGFHAHARDLLYIVINPAKASTQRPGQDLRPLPPLKVGTAGMNPPADGPFIHRVVNPDRTPFHLLAVEVRRSDGRSKPVTSRPTESGFVQIQDHPRLRAWRLILEPGQTAPRLAYRGTGVRIFVRGEQLTIAEAGVPPQSLVVEPGDFEQLRTGTSSAITNSGRTTIELIDVELK